jgi:hypothetical protein
MNFLSVMSKGKLALSRRAAWISLCSILGLFCIFNIMKHGGFTNFGFVLYPDSEASSEQVPNRDIRFAPVLGSFRIFMGVRSNLGLFCQNGQTRGSAPTAKLGSFVQIAHSE